MSREERYETKRKRAPSPSSAYSRAQLWPFRLNFQRVWIFLLQRAFDPQRALIFIELAKRGAVVLFSGVIVPKEWSLFTG